MPGRRVGDAERRRLTAVRGGRAGELGRAPQPWSPEELEEAAQAARALLSADHSQEPIPTCEVVRYLAAVRREG